MTVHIRNVLLFFIGVLAALELSTRLDQWRQYGASPLGDFNYEIGLISYDEHGRRGKPHGHYEKWKLNEHGYRGPPVQKVRDPGVARVATLGASETFGLFETADQEWPRQLERSLDGVEVINAGLAGMAMKTRLDHYRHRVRKHGVDAVILITEYSSYAGITRERREKRERESSARAQAAMAAEAEQAAVYLGLRSIKKMYDAITARLPDYASSAIARLRSARKERKLREKLGDEYRSYREVQAIERQLFADDIASFARELRADGVELIIVIPPRLVTPVTIADFLNSWAYVHEDWIRASIEEFPKVALEVAGRLNVPVVDTRGRFAGHEQAWMADLVHLNDQGARELAAEIAPVLERVLRDHQGSEEQP